ncbi:MAG: hypothetical protein LBO70_02175 [Clostridiales Family XIII bacterium]|jgi:hypothetical protein|nr:hypothetical protein [Clostridiales Family XIII bacterium]
MDRPNVGRKLPRRIGGEEPRIRTSVVKYAFVGLSARAGATTLAFAFADRLARMGARGEGGPEPFTTKKDKNVGSVTVVEINDDALRLCGSDYDRIGIDMRFAGREYLSPYALIARGGSVRGISNIDGGVNWLLRAPGEFCTELEISDYIRLSSSAVGDTVVIDIGGSFGHERRISVLPKLLSDCDRVFAVIDPLPSALMADTGKLELFKSLESVGTDILYVINKMNPGVDVREMRSFIRVRSVVEVPFLEPEHIYAAEYNCCTVYAMPKLAVALDTSFARMTL